MSLHNSVFEFLRKVKFSLVLIYFQRFSFFELFGVFIKLGDFISPKFPQELLEIFRKLWR